MKINEKNLTMELTVEELTEVQNQENTIFDLKKQIKELKSSSEINLIITDINTYYLDHNIHKEIYDLNLGKSVEDTIIGKYIKEKIDFILIEKDKLNTEKDKLEKIPKFLKWIFKINL